MLCPLRLEIDPLPDSSPWILDEAMVKKHVRIDFEDEDENLQDYIAAAILWAEQSTHRTVIARDHRWVLKEFPVEGYGAIRLPRGKTNSVAGIDYSIGGTITTLHGPSSDISPAGSDYQEALSESGAILMPPRTSTWPSVDCDVPSPITITFNAGWSATDMPRDLLSAILMATADAYEMRGSGDVAAAKLNEGGSRLNAREALVSAYMLPRWY